jgi:hypothetical protein
VRFFYCKDFTPNRFASAQSRLARKGAARQPTQGKTSARSVAVRWWASPEEQYPTGADNGLLMLSMAKAAGTELSPEAGIATEKETTNKKVPASKSPKLFCDKAAVADAAWLAGSCHMTSRTALCQFSKHH